MIGRLVRWLLAQRVLASLLLCALTFWFAGMVGTYRVPGRYLGLGMLVGAALFALSLLLFAHRLMTAPPPPALRPLLAHAESLAFLIVLNLILVNLMAPVLRALALAKVGNPVVQTALAAAGSLTGRLLFALFVVGVVALTCLVVVRVADRVVLRWAPVRALAGGLRRATVAAVLLYCLYGVVLAYNGSLDDSPAVAHSAEVVKVHRFEGPLGLVALSWAEVRSWRQPGSTERVLIFPERDHVWPGALMAGQVVTVRVRAGRFGISWVEAMTHDERRALEQLVEAVPSAAVPRRRLLEALAREGRWDDVVKHAYIYVGQYPQDAGFVASIGQRLRAAGRPAPAAALERAASARAPGRTS